jgi:hypothetical protein
MIKRSLVYAIRKAHLGGKIF